MDNNSNSWKDYLYYMLIGIVSLIMLIFMPMLGSVAGLAWVLPTTTAGWVVYVIGKLCSSFFNVMIFHCFNKQGKLNILKHPSYLEAQNLLLEAHSNFIARPRSPSAYNRQIYGKKGVTIFATTLLGAVGLSQAVLSFNVSEFIVQLVALVLGIIFGVLQMKNTEDYWVVEYLDYAKEIYNDKIKNEVTADVQD